MFLYALQYLVGYPSWTLDELKGYASPKDNGYETICHGHPERQIPGVEVTTGPLGQGIANAVGLAIASKNLAAKFNKPSLRVVQSRIYCMTGDGCLMEGIALEAISLAGSLGLDNLVLIYDNNAVTCDGPLDWINTEDVNGKFRASGWYVLDVLDGNYDVSGITTAFEEAKSLHGKPTMINIRTVIGLGTKAAGTFKAHHGAIDAESIGQAKSLAGQDPSTTHMLPVSVLAYFRERVEHGKELEAQWNKLVAEHERLFPELAAELNQRSLGEGSREKGLNLLRSLDSVQPAKMATRESNGEILSQLWRAGGSLFGGGADLVNSCKFSYTVDNVFHPSCGFSGRYVRYGIREHAMAGISNGIAAYSPGTFLPITATFFMFYLYVSNLNTGIFLSTAVTSCSYCSATGCTKCSHGRSQRSSGDPSCDTRLFRRRPERTNTPGGRVGLVVPCNAEFVLHSTMRCRGSDWGVDACAGQRECADDALPRERPSWNSCAGHRSKQSWAGGVRHS